MAHVSKMDSAVDEVIASLYASGKAKAGDAVVVVTGTINLKEGATNLMHARFAQSNRINKRVIRY